MYKNILFILGFLLLGINAHAQWFNTGFSFGGNNRTYRVYVPAAYNADNPASLVLTLHGLGDNIANFSMIGMNLIADTANIIVVVPQAWNDFIATTAWNSGAGLFGYYPNANIDDVGFISALIDTIQSQYAIAPGRVFSCGFSMGGFMTQRLACELNDKITSFASVAGTFGEALPPCTPGRPVNIAHFHGTNDQTVPYNGPQPGIAATELIDFWVSNNGCNPIPEEYTFNDLYPDNYTVDHLIYEQGQENTAVELFRVNGADHIWMTPANDISYTHEIWNFFNRRSPLMTSDVVPTESLSFEVYPNPTVDYIRLSVPAGAALQNGRLRICDVAGKLILERAVYASDTNISLREAGLGQGMYFLSLYAGNQVATKKIIVYNN